MKLILCVMSTSFVTVLALSCGVLVAAPSPRQNYAAPGGQISGHAYGVNGLAFDWALINATDGQHSFTAFSGMSGFYLMRVPPGTYNVSVHVQAYWAPSVTANVTEDSTVMVDFRLQATTTPVQEIQPGIAGILLTITIAVTLALSRRHTNP